MLVLTDFSVMFFSAGSVSYLDFLLPEVREYWAGLFQLHEYEGSTKTLYTWNDMNEPSVFNG